MRKSVTFILLFICVKMLCAQTPDFDSRITRRYISCADVWLNAQDIIPAYYAENKTDSLLLFLDYCEKKCGRREEFFRLRTLLQIKEGKFQPDSINPYFFGNLESYKTRIADTTRFTRHWYREDEKIMDTLSMKIARSIPLGQPSLDADFLIEFYSAAHPDFSALKTDKYKNTRIATFRSKEVLKIKRKSYPNVGIYFGYLQTLGKLSFAGGDPLVGFYYGRDYRRHNFNLTFGVSLSNVSNPYKVIYEDSIKTTTYLALLHFGLGYAYNFVQTKRIDIAFLGGVGLETLTAVREINDDDEEKEKDAKRFYSINLNGGLAIKYKYGEAGYLSLEGRYNYVDFKNDYGGTSLSGDYYSIRLAWGISFNFDQRQGMRDLE